MSAAYTTTTTRRPDGAVLGATRLFNPLIRRFAGARWMPLYGLVEHRGRRSGKLFRTPVIVRPTSDGFVVPMPWREGTDWYRNVRAAGGCVVRWQGRDYPVGQPEVLDTAAAMAIARFGPFERAFIARLGVDRYLRLRQRAPTGR
jgi:deazaflavin-dependent oxidoreductase (nitroreductase family)